MTNHVKPNELQIIRIYDAPVRAVWEAWTDVKKVEKWWGPRGFTLTTHSKDLRVGGHWDYTMHGPDGTDYPNVTKYFEVEPLKRLVYDHGATHDKPPLFRVTVNFTDLKGKTKMDMTMTLATPEAAVETKKFIKKAGGNATWDRLGEFVEKELNGKDVFVINRTFEAPIETLYDLWTKPEHFTKWLPPTGFNMTFIQKPEMKPGGVGFYSMSAQNGGMTMYGKIFYDAFDKPRRLVYRQQFADKDGNMGRHPMAPTWPETMLTTVDFTEEGPGSTRVTMTWQAHGAVKPEELAVFLGERPGMTQGWTGSFDKLEDYIATQK